MALWVAHCVLTGLEESCVTGVCQQAGRSWGNDGSRDFTPARADAYQRPYVAHTGMLCSHRRRVRMLLTFSTFLWRQLNQSCHACIIALTFIATTAVMFPASPLSPSITPSHFHSRLKTDLFHKSFPP